MGLFNKLFGGPADTCGALEAELLQLQVAAWRQIGASKAQAIEMAQSVLAKAKGLVAAGKYRRDRPNQGDWILQEESSNSKLQVYLAAMRLENVRDDDIRGWWNLLPLQCAVFEVYDGMIKDQHWLNLLAQGVHHEEAGRRVLKAFPRFGAPGLSNDQSDDRPLPVELRSRILRFVEGQMGDVDAWRKKMTAASSFNALVRNEIRLGNL